MHPADELHALRAEIRLLREREAALRRRMIDDPGGPACEGAAWRAVVLRRSIRVLDPARLPAAVRADPRNYRLCTRRAVLLRPASAGGVPAGAPAGKTARPARPGLRLAPRRRAPLVDFGLVPAE